jgi:hypothetical protein
MDVRPRRRHADGATANAGRIPAASARLLSAPGRAGLSAAARRLRSSASTPRLLRRWRAALRGLAGTVLLRAGLRLRTALGLRLRPLGSLAPLKRSPSFVA